MGQVLPFQKSEAPRSRRVSGASADIVFFPGVRVEYHESPKAPEGTGRRRRRRRKESVEGALTA